MSRVSVKTMRMGGLRYQVGCVAVIDLWQGPDWRDYTDRAIDAIRKSDINIK